LSRTVTLREKVYKYFREELSRGNLVPGSYVDQNEICEKFKISRAPLRDALIQLEAEQFVEIKPRHGVLIKKLSRQEVKDLYELLGTLEASVLLSEKSKIDGLYTSKMEIYNAKLHEALEDNKFNEYYELNWMFHDVYLSASKNKMIHKIIKPFRQRLYDFPRMKYDKEWESINLNEHQRLIESLKSRNYEGAASILKCEHWSFELHKKRIDKFYSFTV
jgi:DNA-binding GntR family transcriptional regulator